MVPIARGLGANLRDEEEVLALGPAARITEADCPPPCSDEQLTIFTFSF